MTPYQHLYPYFLDLPKLKEALLPFHLDARILNTGKENEYLSIGRFEIKEGDKQFISFIRIHHRETLMVQDRFLFTWQRFENGLAIFQYQLDQPTAAPLEEFIDTLHTSTGHHVHSSILSYSYLVTFIRKKNLLKKEIFHEQYVIVILHQHDLWILPFDSFNESGGDPLYQWPALATLDLSNGKLHGFGMRMGSFTLEISRNGTDFVLQ